VAQTSRFHQNCTCFWSLHPIKPECSPVTTNIKEPVLQQNLCRLSKIMAGSAGRRLRELRRGVGWMRSPKIRPKWSHRKTSYSISNNLMGRDHPSCIPVSPLVGELWHFEYFPTWRLSQPFWILKILIFDHMTVTEVLICCCVPNFIKIGSCVWPPDAHNCWLSYAPLLSNGQVTAIVMATASWRTCRERDGMRPPKFHPIRSIGRWVIVFPTFCNMGQRPSAILNVNFVILDHPRSQLCR